MIDNPCQRWYSSNKTNTGWTTKKQKESLRANRKFLYSKLFAQLAWMILSHISFLYIGSVCVCVCVCVCVYVPWKGG